ncbi:radical SAM protein [Selenihalanaerobacter shriftii]|uniref:7-carboxy-7-deazaguanine synthase n=1 Tax=Selenihalanaerobacter shriftii TaxID=142842 RepID=A0A1T4K6B7_9FIRM|nr:radical SAM protein [Selenihalanaerobacter shriftii]SJZ37969.1 7-carboxy-7-deazaguanine synthase [Selenihalanaerobacter shriftii]
MLVNNIFSSIQGESTYSGFPTTFIRLTGCNLRCSYCDTEYAYKKGEELSIDEVITKVIDLNNDYVCLTGGEPLFQSNIQTLINKLFKEGYEVSIETNGAVDLEGFELDNIKVVMDFKLPSSGEFDNNSEVIYENLQRISKKDDLKFVIGDKEDFLFAKNVIIDKELQKKVNIIFSPIFKRLEPNLLVKWLLESPELNKCRLQLQLHKIIWDEEMKGV